MKLSAAEIFVIIGATLSAQIPTPGPQGGGAGGGGAGTPNITTPFAAATSVAITVTGAAATSLTDCYDNATPPVLIVTGFSVAITNANTQTASWTGSKTGTCVTNSSGVNGTNGSTGATGATGPSGPSGTQGTVGATGPTGASGASGTGTSVTNTFTGSESNNEISFVHNLNTLSPTFGGCTVGGILVQVGARQNGVNAWFIHATTPGVYVCTFSSGAVILGPSGPSGPSGSPGTTICSGVTNSVCNNSSNTYSAGVQDFTAASSALVLTQTAGDSTTKAASTSFVTTAVNSAKVKIPFGFFAFGDSYVLGTGTLNPVAQSAFALLAKSSPSGMQAYNNAVGGFTADQIAFQVFTYFGPSPTLPSVSLINGGANDAACGTSASCVNNYKEEMMASEAWLSIPYSARIMGSAGTGASWSTDTSFPNVNPGFGAPRNYILSPGTPVSTTTNGASKTFSIPSSASPVVGLTFNATNSQTGTFTVTLDGVLQNDSCSGTTTFTSAPCGGLTLNQTTSPFRQEWSVTPNQTHTLVVTTTNTGKVDVLCVDWIPATSAVINAVFVQGTTAQFTNFATYNTASVLIANALKTDGLQVYFVDLVNGTPGVNATTDIATTATASCDASTTAGHPNSQCGYLHMAQTIYNAEVSNGYVFTNTIGGPNLPNVSGVPRVITTISTAFAQAAVSGAALFTAPISGYYRITYTGTLSTAATTSSILGGTTGFSVTFLDAHDFVTRSPKFPEVDQTGTSLSPATGNTINTTAGTISGSMGIYANSGNAITYSLGYTSVGATAMQYGLSVRVESMDQ